MFAVKALVENGKSLLPSGITSISGRFNKGNAVLLLDETEAEIAVGMVNYGASELKRIMGVKSSEIESILGYKDDDEVIHRDNLVLTAQLNEIG